MKKKTPPYVAVALCALLVLSVLLLAQGRPGGGGSIVLPEMPVDTDLPDDGSGQESLNIISIQPDTVQAAVSTLARPAAYRRTQTVETFWSGGSGESVSQVAVSGGRTRVDTALPDGGTVHLLVEGDSAAVWYDEETEWIGFSSDDFTADIAQRMLSYEDVLELDAEEILLAEFRQLEELYCIYLTTRPDRSGYADSYWISVASGLLCRAERHCGEELIYRFTAPEPDAEPPEESSFLLPDGSALTQ